MSKVGVAEFAPLSDSDDGKPGTQLEREKSSLRDDWEQPDRNIGKMKSVTGGGVASQAERYAPESVKGFSAAKASAAATAELADEAFIRGGKLVTNWGYEEVLSWLASHGFRDVVPLFRTSNVNGAVLPKLNDRLLNEMGITNVGVRIRLLNEIVKIQVIARSEWRNQVVWASEQYRPGPCNNTLPLGFPCCFLKECLLGKPDIYTLTNSKLNILAAKARCKLFCELGCCGHEIRSNNVDLTLVHDIDTSAQTNLLGDPLGHIIVSTLSKEQYKLKLRTSECQKVTQIMSHTREEAVNNIRMYTMAR